MSDPSAATRSARTPNTARANGANGADGATAGLAAALQRGELLSPDCPSREVLKHVTSRWGVLLLVVLMGGMHRFSELHRKVGGVSEKMLAQTLRWLEADGLVHRHSLPTVPPHVEYTLTPLGMEAGKRVEALADWIESSLPDIMAARRLLGDEAANPPDPPDSPDSRVGPAQGLQAG